MNDSGIVYILFVRRPAQKMSSNKIMNLHVRYSFILCINVKKEDIWLLYLIQKN